MSTIAGDELRELLALTRDSDSVELKLTIPEHQQRSTVFGLGMDPLEAQIRLVHFFDTPELTLNAKGVVVRARRVQGRGDDTVIKLRPVVPANLPEDIRQSASMFVEVDAMPGGFVCSASMKGRLGEGEVKRAVAGERAVRKLFSKEQRAFYAAHAPEGLGLDDLTLLGPIFVLKLKFTPEELPRKMVAEMWLYPDGERILELSTKCAPDEAVSVAMKAKKYLTERGIDLGGAQQTKTRTALSFFSRELKAAAG
jgi:hypothetical protein